MDAKERVEALEEKLEDGDRGGCPEDRALLIRFAEQLQVRREEYGWHRIEKLLRHTTRMSEHADPCLHESMLAERDDDDYAAAETAAQGVVKWIHREYDVEDGSQETNRDYRVAFRILAKRVTRGEDVPDTHDWISTKTTRDYDPEPDAAAMLDWEADVKPMLEAATNPRDAAAIALQFEGGFRGGELYDLRVSDIADAEHSVKVRVDGKRGAHDVHLILAVPYLQRWLAAHPGDDGDYLWTRRDDPTRVSYKYFLKMFRGPADRAGVDKPVTPTNFRKSNAYWLARQDKSQAFIEDRQGRARGSPVISRYVAKFSGETAETEYAQLHGIETEPDTTPETPTPVTCPRCGKETPRERDFCLHCNQALDLEAQSLVETTLETIEARAADAEDRDRRADLLKAHRTIRERPAVMDTDELHEFVSSLED